MPRYDIGVRDSIDNLTLAVEAKRRFDTDLTWAAETRSALVGGDDALARVPFLIVTPDRGYLFAGREAPVEIDLSAQLAPLFARIGTTASGIHPAAFEALVAQWLGQALEDATAPVELQPWLPAAGAGRVELVS